MGCVFCRIAAGEIPASKVLENEHVVAFHDLNPEAPVHVLVIPRRHLSNLGDAGRDHTALLGEVLLACRQVAAQCDVLHSGFRVVLNTHADAGQTVDHLHAHVLGGRTLAWPPG